jgi:hypothetical protein
VGRVTFLKYAWNYQKSLQAEGDAGYMTNAPQAEVCDAVAS